MPLYKKIQQNDLLLDTHIWIWLMIGDEKLSTQFLNSVEKIQGERKIYISAISVWEFGMLAEKGRIQLEMDPLKWVDQALALPKVELLPISSRIAIQSTRLPGTIHGDPADRLLIASARENSALLVTHDGKLLDYGRGKFIGVLDPC